MSVRFRGFDRVRRKLKRMASEAGAETASGTRILGEHVVTDVKNARPGRGVPVDRGTLRNTGRVTGPDTDGVVRLTFGGASAPYAVVQHERTDFSHRLGEARYLVRGVERASDEGAPLRALREVGEELVRLGKVQA
ncbi:MAG: hypothetical protein ACLFWG_00355 [Longimicrobiales bacterium]